MIYASGQLQIEIDQMILDHEAQVLRDGKRLKNKNFMFGNNNNNNRKIRNNLVILIYRNNRFICERITILQMNK
jgi:hypothetical protein